MATEVPPAPGGDYQPPYGGSTAVASSGYPVRFDVEYPDELNRWLPLIKWLLAIPQLLIVYVLGAVVQIIVLIAFFAILFTRKFPKGLFDFVLGVMRWGNRVTAYAFVLVTDRYPPFRLDA